MNNNNHNSSNHVIDKMQKHSSITKSRLDLFLAENNQFSNVNLIPKLYKAKVNGVNYIKIYHYAVPNLKRISFKEAIQNEFKQVEVGAKFGPSWSTHWFHIQLKLPDKWVGEEVQFRWNTNSEVLIYSKEGEPIQALTGEGGGNQRLEYTLTRNSSGGESFEFYLEMACNGLFGNGPYLIGPPEERVYPLTLAELAVPNLTAWGLFYDFQIIRDMAKKLPDKSSRAERALLIANRIMNTFQKDGDDDNLLKCRQIAKEFLSFKGPSNNHELIAVGHCHIDTAWLWVYDETKRKVARSWSTQLQLMEIYKDFIFTASQAQQFEWLEQNYPTLFQRIQTKVKDGQFFPIGGTWVEMDCNVPSGEGLCRQFLLGQRYFESKFGRRCKVFWLPDTFGYSAQLPQIIKLSGLDYFFTQKLSWNNINKFPHTTFFWKGLDGTKVLSHMAPGETYSAQINVEELIFSETNNKDKNIVNKGLLLFGNGDGGGGPLPSMIERLNRLKDVEGLPKVKFGDAEAFYNEINLNEEINELPEWDGELYLELHRGTYTSHGIIKKFNRFSEFLLREVELIWCLARIYKGAQYPNEKINQLWKLTCLNQFHDVLPGSSIGLVYDDAIKFYEQVAKQGKQLLNEAMDLLSNDLNNNNHLLLNPSAWSRTEVIEIELNNNDYLIKNLIQKDKDNQTGYLLIDNIQPFSLISVDLEQQQVLIQKVLKDQSYHVLSEYSPKDGTYTLRNRYLEVKINSTGQIISLIELSNQREIIPSGQLANQLKLYEDIPLYWDAWDVEVYHLEKYELCHAHTIQLNSDGPLTGSLLIDYNIGEKSKLRQIIQLKATSKMVEVDTQVDWHENRKFLKAEFVTNLRSDHAIYETQFGIIRRPTHFNTSWDLSKFEVCSHKFATLSDASFSLSILNDCKYGFATKDSTMRLSLLRSPKSPDDQCDMGKHRFKYALYPHYGTFVDGNVPKLAHAFNNPLRYVFKSDGFSSITSLPSIKSKLKEKPLVTVYPNPMIKNKVDTVILETVKISEDDPNALILRFYESSGTFNKILVRFHFELLSIHLSNVLEEAIQPLEVYGINILETLEDEKERAEGSKDKVAALEFKAFQIITLKVRF